MQFEPSDTGPIPGGISGRACVERGGAGTVFPVQPGQRSWVAAGDLGWEGGAGSGAIGWDHVTDSAKGEKSIRLWAMEKQPRRSGEAGNNR